MRIAMAQLNVHIGDFEGNKAKIIDACHKAISLKADLVCFSELVTCGYPPQDFLEFADFVQMSENVVDSLLELSQEIAIVVGSPIVNPKTEGKDLLNCAIFLEGGKRKYTQAKTLLPTYDIFDEYRYFEPATEWNVVDFKGKKIALTVCEDIWNVGNENPLYPICPMDEMMDQRPDLMLNISASPFHYAHAQERIDVLKSNVERYKVPIFYCNEVGAQTEIIFDGGSIVMSPNGQVYEEMPYFEECIRVYDLQDVIDGKIERVQEKNKIALIHDAIVLGIKDYFAKLGLKKAILGLSGGIDSALTAVLAVRALGSENVRVLLMPSQYSSGHSVDDAKALAEALGIRYDIVPIRPIFDMYEKTLGPLFDDLPPNVTEENIQARIRGMLLMAVSNKHGNILLNTTNKSELAVGYGTMYGDLCGGLAVLGDVYKTEVYELSHYVNKDKEIIPINSIQKPPSAELRPGQKDSDSLPEYNVLDPILYQYVEMRKSPQDIIEMGYDEATVRRALRLVNINEFKRYQSPPVIRVSSKSFGMGRRLPIVAKYLN